MNYYQRNKEHYKKGGKYYKYIPLAEQHTFKLEIKRGLFLLTFD